MVALACELQARYTSAASGQQACNLPPGCRNVDIWEVSECCAAVAMSDVSAHAWDIRTHGILQSHMTEVCVVSVAGSMVTSVIGEALTLFQKHAKRSKNNMTRDSQLAAWRMMRYSQSNILLL